MRTLAMTVIGLSLGASLPAFGCLWDRDTPTDEAKGMPEVIAVLTGRFPRNPPLYYERRLARVTDHLNREPADLAAYDDAGVACDRLGRGDEAIAWTEKKRLRLVALDAARPEIIEHQYRYHANLGTFLVHRWIRRGADRSRLDEVKSARDEIARALAINPRAHFGREKYQLRAIEWIISPPKVEPGRSLPNLLGWDAGDIYGQSTEPQEADDAVRGLAGLIVLGNAWESVDVFHALNIALQRDSLGFTRGRDGGRNTLAHFAMIRCEELIDAGKGSLIPNAPRGADLKALIRLARPDFVNAELLLNPNFEELRREADRWQEQRTAFMTTQLKAGRHPDTDDNFWHGHGDSRAPGLPRISVPDAYDAWQLRRTRAIQVVFIGGPALVAVLAIGSRLWRVVRKVHA